MQGVERRGRGVPAETVGYRGKPRCSYTSTTVTARRTFRPCSVRWLLVTLILICAPPCGLSGGEGLQGRGVTPGGARGAWWFPIGIARPSGSQDERTRDRPGAPPANGRACAATPGTGGPRGCDRSRPASCATRRRCCGGARWCVWRVLPYWDRAPSGKPGRAETGRSRSPGSLPCASAPALMRRAQAAHGGVQRGRPPGVPHTGAGRIGRGLRQTTFEHAELWN